ncbi:MAG: L-2-hydroxyglutarate oxidase, partial [Candidatus Obscuribacterales bacterium]|nr:L-2-hydroxyglutarate oxidase [Candidatus Obscuribacterales bacterium]
KFPFLGVHLSRTFDDSVKVGPGALLAFGRNCYTKFSFQPLDFSRMVTTKAMWKLFASKDFRTVLKQEWKKSLCPSEVLKEARMLIPELADGCLVESPSGIRAQVVSSDGDLVDDLTILTTNRSIHVLNAVSPALTCSLPFADHIAGLVKEKLLAV